jgi:hypothetical protein
LAKQSLHFPAPPASPLSSDATTQGHNCMPYQNGTWALAKTSSGGTLYDGTTADFSKLFQIT